MNLNNELLDIFSEEVKSLLDEMRKDLTILSEEGLPPGGAGKKKSPVIRTKEPFGLDQGEPRLGQPVLHRLFRCTHTMKSSAAIVGSHDLEKVAQATGKVYKAAMDKELKINADIIKLLCESIEACQKTLDDEEVVDYQGLLERLSSILQP